jgi:hypothetical protein
MKNPQRFITSVVLLATTLLTACVNQARTEVVAAVTTDECVVLLHGLNRSWRAMRPMAEALQREGFTTANVDYPSQSGSIEEIAPVAVETGLHECRETGATKIHFWPGFEMLSGNAGMQLGTDVDSMPIKLGPVDFELGVIAGTRTINVVASGMLPDADDGKVTVARTKVDGMDDFLTVGNSHRYITRSDIVIRNTASFLRNGTFLDSDKKLMVE